MLRYLRALDFFRALDLAGLRSPRSPCPAFTFFFAVLRAVLGKRAAHIIAFLDAAFRIAADVPLVAARRDQLTFRRARHFVIRFMCSPQLDFRFTNCPQRLPVPSLRRVRLLRSRPGSSASRARVFVPAIR